MKTAIKQALAGLAVGAVLAAGLSGISRANVAAENAPVVCDWWQASKAENCDYYTVATAENLASGQPISQYFDSVGPWPVSIPPWRIDTIKRISAYNAHASQTDNDPLVASCGPLADAPGQVIAVSRDLFFAPDGRKRCGQEVAVVYADGRVTLAYIWDTMAARYQGTVDVLLDTHQEAVQHGVQQGELHWLD